MKKISKIFGLIAVAAISVIMAVCFAACSDNGGNGGEGGSGETREEWTTYAGTYKFSQLEASAGGYSYTVNAGETFGGVEYTEDLMVIVLKTDGTASMTGEVMGTTNESNLTWYVEDGELKFNEMTSTAYTLNITDGRIEYAVELTVSGTTSSSKYILLKA